MLQAAAASPLQGFVQTEARGVSGYTRLAGDETEGEACGSQKPRPSQGERGVLPMKRYSSAGGDDSFSRRTGSNLDEESFKLRAEIAPLAARTSRYLRENKWNVPRMCSYFCCRWPSFYQLFDGKRGAMRALMPGERFCAVVSDMRDHICATDHDSTMTQVTKSSLYRFLSCALGEWALVTQLLNGSSSGLVVYPFVGMGQSVAGVICSPPTLIDRSRT